MLPLPIIWQLALVSDFKPAMYRSQQLGVCARTRFERC
jgi:hypothetical protein